MDPQAAKLIAVPVQTLLEARDGDLFVVVGNDGRGILVIAPCPVPDPDDGYRTYSHDRYRDDLRPYRLDDWATTSTYDLRTPEEWAAVRASDRDIVSETWDRR